MEQGIYGLGRFGSFWASVIADAGQIKAYNRSERPVPSGVQKVPLAEACAVDALWLCTSISSMEAVSLEIAPHLKPGTLVLDTCSVKVAPLSALHDHLDPGVQILGTHPMFGPDSASNGLANLAMVLSPVRVDDATLAWWRNYFESKGLMVYVMSPHEHDLAAARTQGVTHFIGRFLAEMGLEESPIATMGYKKIKEVMEQTCNDPWQLFLDLQHYNPYGRTVRAELHEAFERLWQKGGF